MIPNVGWADSPEIYDTPLMKSLSPDSQRLVTRLANQDFTWRSINLVYEAFGHDARLSYALSQSGSVALYEKWFEDESVENDIAGAWAISLGTVIFYYTKSNNEKMANELRFALDDFVPHRVGLLISQFKNDQNRRWDVLLDALRYDVDPELLIRVG